MPTVVVQGTAAIQVTVSPGLGGSVVVNGTTTTLVGTAGINPFIAGDNITITTTGGGITIIGRNPPVSSVQGKVGTVTLTPQDIGAADLVHSHSTTQITSFTAAASQAAPVQSVAGRTGAVVLTTTDIALFTTSARLASPVQSVAGRTGAVTLTTTDIASFSAASSQFSPVQSVAGRTGAVTLTTTDIALFTTSARLASPVQSVAGRTGAVVLTHLDVTAAAATHTHSTTEPWFVAPNAPVQSVSGRTGHVVLTSADVSAAQSLHMHSVSDISGFAAAASAASPVQSVQGRTGAVVISHVDVTAAAATHTHSYVSSLNALNGAVTLVEGAGINISINGNSVAIATDEGQSQVAASIWPAIILGG